MPSKAMFHESRRSTRVPLKVTIAVESGAENLTCDEVIGLPIGFDELGENEPHLVPLFSQRGSHEVRSRTSLNPDQR
jgi:hypothetical protein